MTYKLGIFIVFILVLVVIASCDFSTKPYIHYELSADKVDDDCSKTAEPWTVESNTAGERYVFEYCLKEGFDTSEASMEREGDTLILHLPEEETGNKVVYKLTLDIDAYPKYNHIKLGDKLIDVSVSGN